MNPLTLEDRVRAALLEDLGMAGDVTSQATVPVSRKAEGFFLAKADGVLSGLRALEPVFTTAAELTNSMLGGVELLKKDGDTVKRGDHVARVNGSARALLAGERTALNLLCHFSGIATATADCARRVAHTRAKILDTRKTMPLWRDLAKEAVAHGGGVNHRIGLYDMVLIKDNHLALWGSTDPAGAANAARQHFPELPVEVEVVDLAGLQQVCTHAAPAFILLDNFERSALKEAVAWVDGFFTNNPKRPRPLLEASGGITLETLVPIAETGVDRISIGALTHSVRALDLSLEIKF